MEWNVENIDEIVFFINEQLKTRPMKEIEEAEFGVNARVIHKRLSRLGYKKIEGFYSKPDGEGKATNQEKDNKDDNKDDKKEIDKCITKAIQPKKQSVELFNDKDMLALKELIQLIEPIKEIIQMNNKSITDERIIDVEPIEIKLSESIGCNSKAVGMRIDGDIYSKWLEFTTKHKKNFRSYQLLSQALLEFMDKYN